MECFSFGETEPFNEDESKASFPGLGCGFLWNMV